jgi:hypothetical protein
MNDREFSIGGRDFKLCKIDAFKQFHIVRRIGPILSDILPALADAKKLQNSTSDEEKLVGLAKIAAPVMNGLSKLSDVDSELVLFGLLQAVEMKQSAGNWAKVSSNSMLMIQDLELPILLQLAGRAFVFNLSGFFSALQKP